MKSQTSGKTRVGFFNTHPIQYAAPLYRFINRSPDIEAVPIYLTDCSLRGEIDAQFGETVVWDVDLLGGTDPIFVPGYRTRTLATGWPTMPCPVWQTIRRASLDALVVYGYATGSSLIAVLAARRCGIPVLLCGDSQIGVHRSWWRRAIKSKILPILLLLFDGVLAIGTRNREYYQSYGVSEQKIFSFPFAVDNHRFIARSKNIANRLELRRELGLRDGVPVIVCVGKLTAQKRTNDLLEAVDMLRRQGTDCDLLIVGSGREEPVLRKRGEAMHGPPPRFTGFVNQLALPDIFAAADLFAMVADNESWGLVINEAMCAGLPVVVSREVGAVADLVHDGRNGKIFPAGDIAALGKALKLLACDPAARQQMGDESRRIISGWSYAEDLQGLRAALRSRALLPSV